MIIYITHGVACVQYVRGGRNSRPHACGLPATIGLTRSTGRNSSELIPLCALHWIEATHRFGNRMSVRTREEIRKQEVSWRASQPR